MLSHFSPTLFDPMDCSLPGSSLSMGFSRQEYWSRLLCPPAADLPDTEIKPTSLMSNLRWQAGPSPLAPPGKPKWSRMDPKFKGLLSKYFQKFILKNKNICKYTYIFASSCHYAPSSIHFSLLSPLIPSSYHFLNILGNIQFLISVCWKQQWISDAEVYGCPQEALIVKHRVMRNLIDKVLVKEDFFFFFFRVSLKRKKTFSSFKERLRIST